MPLPNNYQGAFRVNSRFNRVIFGSMVVRENFTNPLAAVTNGYSVSHVGAAAAGTRNMTLGGSLAGKADVPRNVVITVTHASAVVAMSGTITGFDIDGKILTEDWAVTAGGTSKTFTGKKAFAGVTKITETIAADASANSIVAGTGVVLGLGARVACVSAIKEVVDGAVVTTGVLTLASSVAANDPRGTYTPATAPDGAHDYDLWYLSDDPQNS